VSLYHLYNRHLSNVTKVSAKINTMQNVNILRFVLTIKQKSGRPPISPFLTCQNHGRAMVGRIMESPCGVMMTWSSQCLWLTSWLEPLKNSTTLTMMTMTTTRLVSSSSSSESSSYLVYTSPDQLASQKLGYWRSSRFLFDSSGCVLPKPGFGRWQSRQINDAWC